MVFVGKNRLRLMVLAGHFFGTLAEVFLGVDGDLKRPFTNQHATDPTARLKPDRCAKRLSAQRILCHLKIKRTYSLNNHIASADAYTVAVLVLSLRFA